MKKLSLLIAMILVVTISGVYATWNYSRETVDAKQAGATVVITGIQDSAKGSITIVSAPKRVIIDDTNADYEAELFFGELSADGSVIAEVTNDLGEVKVGFEAAPGADADVATNGIKMQWTLTVNSVGEWNGAPIFTVVASGVFNGGAACNEATLNLSEVITLAEISLPTYADYQAFTAAINGITFTLTVSEIIA